MKLLLLCLAASNQFDLRSCSASPIHKKLAQRYSEEAFVGVAIPQNSLHWHRRTIKPISNEAATARVLLKRKTYF